MVWTFQEVLIYPFYSFRLCSSKEKTPLERFIRAPDFHQFPQVNINSTKELIVSLHSLPHSDLQSDYPMFSWVLNDLPSETPQRKSGEQLPENFEASFTGSDCFHGSINQKKDRSNSPSNVVRKLEFKNFSSAGEGTSNRTKITSFVVKESNTVSVRNVNRTSVESSWKLNSPEYFRREKGCKFSAKEKQKRPQPQKGGLFCEETKWLCSKQEATGFLNKHTKASLLASSKSFASNGGTENKSLAAGCGDTESLFKSSLADQKTNKNASVTLQEYIENITPIEKPYFDRSLDPESLKTNSESRGKQEIFKKSLLACDVAARDCRSKILNSDKLQSLQKTKTSNGKICDGLNCESVIDMKIRNIKQVPMERQRLDSGSGNLEETMRRSRIIDDCSNVLHRDENGIGNIISDVKHVMGREYERTFNERIGKCCLASGGYCEKKGEDSEKETVEVDKTVDTKVSNSSPVKKWRDSVGW